MKKIISLFLCCAVFTSVFCNNIHASTKDELLEQKLSVVKSRIGETDEYEIFTSTNSKNNTGNYSYMFNWKTDDNTKRLEVSINQDDIITDYYKSCSDDTYDVPVFEYHTNEEILAAAEKFFNKINPTLKDKYVFETEEYADLYSNVYFVYLHREENGIKVKNDNAIIRITKNLKTVTSMNLSYTPIANFDDVEDLISKENAVKNYIDKLGYKLVYNINNNYKKSQVEAVLNYVPDYDTTLYIDAITGEIFDYSKYNSNLTEERSTANNKFTADTMVSGGGGGGGVSFTPAEIDEMKKLEGFLSAEEIEVMLKNTRFLEIPESSKITYCILQKDYYNDEKYTYFMDFQGDNETFRVTCDAKNGELLSFNRYIDRENNNEAELDKEILDEKMVKAAKGIADKYFTDDSENTFILNTDTKADNYITAKRIVHGIECVGNGLNLRIDPYSGKVSYYTLNYNDVDFPEPEAVIGLEQAYKEMFDLIPYDAVYMPLKTDENTYNCKLIYDFDGYDISMNAITGKVYSYADARETITDYSDVKGHYAENVINKLKAFGIGFTGGEFKPDEIIRQGEFVTLLAYVFKQPVIPIIYRNDSNYKTAYDYVINRGIIPAEEIDENAPLTREDASVIMVKAMKYDKVADLKQIFVPTFDDVENNIGYISILNAMNIITGDGNGKFNPHKNLSRADAAIILYNYLINQ